jgi:hypothetical protein
MNILKVKQYIKQLGANDNYIKSSLSERDGIIQPRVAGNMKLLLDPELTQEFADVIQ